MPWSSCCRTGLRSSAGSTCWSTAGWLRRRIARREPDAGGAVEAIRGHQGMPVVTDVDDAPGGGELSQMHVSRICASDFRYLRLGTQRVLGHELAGVRADGTPVAVEGLFGCGECEYCRSGRNNLCAQASKKALGIMQDGG